MFLCFFFGMTWWQVFLQQNQIMHFNINNIHSAIFKLSVNFFSFLQTSQWWETVRYISAAPQHWGSILCSTWYGGLQPGAQLHCKEGRAMERLQWRETQGESEEVLFIVVTTSTEHWASDRLQREYLLAWRRSSCHGLHCHTTLDCCKALLKS